MAGVVALIGYEKVFHAKVRQLLLTEISDIAPLKHHVTASHNYIFCYKRPSNS
jgi:hypothetical protein